MVVPDPCTWPQNPARLGPCLVPSLALQWSSSPDALSSLSSVGTTPSICTAPLLSCPSLSFSLPSFLSASLPHSLCLAPPPSSCFPSHHPFSVRHDSLSGSQLSCHSGESFLKAPQPHCVGTFPGESLRLQVSPPPRQARRPLFSLELPVFPAVQVRAGVVLSVHLQDLPEISVEWLLSLPAVPPAGSAWSADTSLRNVRWNF